MLGIKPYLSFNGNCEEAMSHYMEALGGETMFIQRYGESPMPSEGIENLVMHMTIKAGDSLIMASDCPPNMPSEPGTNTSLAIGIDDAEEAERIFAKLSEGGTVTMPIQETFWAKRFGMMIDRYGINWMVNCEKPHGEMADVAD